MKMCEFFPAKDEETCVCSAGSDISGYEKIGACTEKYSMTCQWACELRKGGQSHDRINKK